MVARGGRVPEGLEQRAGRRQRAPAAAPRHHGALQAHARRLRLTRAALACTHAHLHVTYTHARGDARMHARTNAHTRALVHPMTDRGAKVRGKEAEKEAK